MGVGSVVRQSVVQALHLPQIPVIGLQTADEMAIRELLIGGVQSVDYEGGRMGLPMGHRERDEQALISRLVSGNQSVSISFERA